MKLINRTNNNIIVNKVRFADTFLSRLVGLIGKREFIDQALILKGTQQIHTFFMKFPIDLIYLSKKWEVIGMISPLPPFHISPRIQETHMVVELPRGMIRTSETKVGDHLIVSNQLSDVLP